MDLGHNGFPVSLNYFTALPDVTYISDPNAQVIFKLLAKKDAVTKERSLNELTLYIESPVEEGLIICWLQIYPKLAIDNSRNVRVLAHGCQATLLQKVGGKAFSKYLKTSLPTWLLGLFDADKLVASATYRGLLEALGDKDKIDKTWGLFLEPIVNYISNVMLESHESLSDQRYVKVDDSQGKYERVLNLALLMLTKIMSIEDEKVASAVKEVLDSDRTWEYFARSVSPDTFNVTLFRTYLSLFKVTFSEGMLPLLDVKATYKVVSKKVLKHVKLKPLKGSGSIIYLSVVVPFWDTLTVLTALPQKTKLKKNFWAIGSKGRSRLLEYLKTGHCSSSPAYYDSVLALFEALRDAAIDDEEFLSFESEADAAAVVDALLSQFRAAPGAYRVALVRCVLGVDKLFGHKNTQKILVTVEDGLRNDAWRSKIVAQLSNVPSSSLEAVSSALVAALTEETALTVDSYTFSSLPASVFDTHLGLVDPQGLLGRVLDGLLENTALTQPKDAFEAIALYLDKGLPTDKLSQLLELTEQLPQFVEEGFVDAPLGLLAKLILRSDDVDTLIDDFYTKLSLDTTSHLPALLDVLAGHRSPVKNNDALYQHLVHLALAPECPPQVYQFADDEAILERLIDSQTKESFVQNIVGVLGVRLDNPKLLPIIKEALSLGNSSFANFAKDSPLFKLALLDNIFEGTGDLGVLASFDVSVDEDLTARVHAALNLVNLNLLSIANPLQHNVALIQGGGVSIDPAVLNIGRYLLHEPEISVLGGLCGEYLADVAFLDDVDPTVGDELSRRFLTQWAITLVDEVALLAKVDSTPLGFYHARLVAKLLTNYAESITPAEFETLDLPLQKLAAEPVKLAAHLVGFSRFLDSPKFDRIRNFCAAEILGVRSDAAILTEGLKWVTLSINFFGSSEAIPPHRLAMVLGQIGRWLESDIAYDDEFVQMRVQLSRFLTGLLQLSPQDKAYEVAVLLASDNLSTYQANTDLLHLKYATFKLLNVLFQSDVEEKPQLLEEAFDVALEGNVKLQPVAVVNELVAQVLTRATPPLELVEQKLPQLYGLVRLPFVSLQRLATNLLADAIVSIQKDFVVEYTLSKDDTPAQLPQQLLDIIGEIPDDIDSHLASVTSYLWAWLLIFKHFSDITYQIRNAYTAQLKNSGVIELLLDYTFSQIDVANTSFLRTLGDIKNNKIVSENFTEYSPVGNDIDSEIPLLLVHLYYLGFQHLGSQVQAWYNSIRDLQLKNNIGKFSLTYVSPLIISKILLDVSSQKDRLINKEQNMQIKVSSTSNEIRSVYDIDEQTMEMVIRIPPTYPLANVLVEGPLRLGVKENQWKAWLLASQRIISLTNGSIIEAVELFNRNVNLHFLGFEECAICYSILHQDHSLPSKTCPTCSNKFHAACLYKWFKSSGASTCPLCRSAFNFRKS